MSTGVMITLIICGTIVILSIGSIIKACIVKENLREVIEEVIFTMFEEGKIGLEDDEDVQNWR